MRILTLTAAALIATMAGAPAFAADVVMESPAASAGFNWSGVYVGVQGGYADGHVDMEFDGGNLDFDVGGGLVGGHVARRWQLNSAVIGVEGELNYADIDGQVESTLPGITTLNTGKMNWFGSVNAEIGIPLGRVLLYATGGLAFADIESTTTVTDNSGTNSASDDDFGVGWTAGLGADYALTDKFILGARYRYYEFDTSFEEQSVAAGITALAHTFDSDLHAVSLKASYKF